MRIAWADILFFALVFTLILFFTGDLTVRTTEQNYEQVANCIAEYDYQHPERSQIDNLVISLKECQ